MRLAVDVGLPLAAAIAPETELPAIDGLAIGSESGARSTLTGVIISHGHPDHVGLVAGGIGQTPFLAHIRELLGQRGYGGQPARRRVARVSLYYGVRTADLAAGVDDFRQAGAEVVFTKPVEWTRILAYLQRPGLAASA